MNQKSKLLDDCWKRRNEKIIQAIEEIDKEYLYVANVILEQLRKKIIYKEMKAMEERRKKEKD